MNAMILVLLLQAATVNGDPDSYAEARRKTTETGRPMVILVGADWCPACVEMKKNVVPKVRHRGLFGKVAYAFVNLDKNRKLGRELTEGGPIPQIIMFRKTPEGWRRRSLVGGQTPEAIEAFVKEGIQLDEASRPSTPNNEKVLAPPKKKDGDTTA
ncbi:MAG: thioredoxin family protein [Pirellulales bacterium]|nr:thioredoxin family protein [Pirellulales bacterium]